MMIPDRDGHYEPWTSEEDDMRPVRVSIAINHGIGTTRIAQPVLDRLWREAVWNQVVAETIEAETAGEIRRAA
jgi:hypothetical protein